MKRYEASVYKARRDHLRSQLTSGQVLIYGNTYAPVNYKDNYYPFRQDSTLLYYTGLDLAGVHLIIDLDTGRDILCGDDLTIHHIIWTGKLPTMSELAEGAGIDQVISLDKMSESLGERVHYLPPYRGQHVLYLSDLLDKGVQEIKRGASPELIHAVIAQRSIKEDREIQQMSQAVARSYEMHAAVMKCSNTAKFEYDMIAEANRVLGSYDATYAYQPILTKHGEVLHNHHHHHPVSSGDLILFDGGAESDLRYAGDITRTFPIGGKWTSLQKDIYHVVHQSYKDAIAALRPGITYRSVHDISSKTIAQGMKDLGFLKGDIDEAVAAGAHTMFFQHGLGHMIGLDVHDMENFDENLVGYSKDVTRSTEFGTRSLRLGRKLQKGYAITVEPGIYIIPALIDMRRAEGAYKDFINYDMLEQHKDFGGIRLEDNFVITADGAQLIGPKDGLPQEADKISELILGA